MDIFQSIRALDLASGEFVVVGGGILVALGLLPWDEDIDLAVRPSLFKAFKASGEWRTEYWQQKEVLKKGIYDVGVSFGDWNLEQLLSDALWIQDIPFISLAKLLLWKRAMGRARDLQHSKLIEDYLSGLHHTTSPRMIGL